MAIQNVFLVLFLASGALSNLLSSSHITGCINDGSESLECTQQMVVAITLEQNQGPTETISISRVTNDDGTISQLEHPSTVACRTTSSYVIYPINRRSLFWADAQERVVFDSGCIDFSYASNPTCGWAFDDTTGQPVTDSQGFCCYCSVWQALHIDDPYSRGNVSCTLGAATAHCLDYKLPLYLSFNVGTSRSVLEITCDLQQWDATTAAYNSHPITLSTSSPGARSSDGFLIGRLEGNFEAYTQPPVLSQKIFFLPWEGSDRATPENQKKYAMLIDRDLVSFDGGTCDRIGTSYSPFRYQSNACRQHTGACLRNQLEDYHQSDLDALEAGGLPQYFVSAYFSPELFQDGDDIFLGYTPTNMQRSVVTLTIKADDMQFVTNRSPGKIVEASLPAFESLTQGSCSAKIRNIGLVIADFTVELHCSSNIQSVEAQQITLQANQTKLVTFRLQTLNGNASESQCEVRLLDSQFEIVDDTVISFETYSVNPTPPPSPGEDDDVPVIESFDVSCMILDFSDCWSNILRLGLMILGIVVAVILLGVKSIRRMVFRCLFCPCRTCADMSKRGEENHRSTRWVYLNWTLQKKRVSFYGKLEEDGPQIEFVLPKKYRVQVRTNRGARRKAPSELPTHLWRIHLTHQQAKKFVSKTPCFAVVNK
ncbi:putative Hapless 2 [Paratrimastix pyriformis]|uniref:Hapless 2 n=1 Tax=Paratrimastix pyriformis TaxID=342808 RepID=A0ABQ8UEL8_9EUKA|nr:putative Hapless 2 [Paratrimastix pyriformis]